MKILLYLLFFLMTYFSAYSQEILIDNTIYKNINQSYSLLKKGDTSTAYQSLKAAIRLGWFDEQYFTQSSILQKAFTEKQRKNIIEGIKKNRNKIQTPKNIKVNTKDIDYFWQCFEQIDEMQAETIFLEKYFRKGSIGLRTFYQIRLDEDIGAFLKKIKSIRNYYQSIKDQTLEVQKLKPQFLEAAQKLEQLYPESIFPPIYFLIGKLNNVGTTDGLVGLLIGTEHLCKSITTDTSSLSEIEKMIIFNAESLVPIIVHEYVHIQQKNTKEQTLLDFTISEGVADFITYLIIGKYTDPNLYQYGFKNEQKIWEHFKKEMMSENTDNWLFNVYNPDTGYPANLGYFIGFKIAEAYYNKNVDKTKAVKELLEIKDFKEVFSKSGY